MNRTHTQRTTFDDGPELTEPPFPQEAPALTAPSWARRTWTAITSAPWHKWLMMGGVAYTVVWSILLYFGWKGSPDWITWMDLATGAILLHLVHLLQRETDLDHLGVVLRLLQLISLLYATAWTLIIMFIFGVEILLPLDFISLYVTITLMRQLSASLRLFRHPRHPPPTGKKSLP